MSDIRFNQWLHNSGTGGVSQVDGGHVGIGTTNPEIAVHSGNNKILNVGIVTASSYYGDGSNLTNLPSQVTITGNADNRVITGGSGTNLNGESNFTFDGSTLSLTGNLYSSGQVRIKTNTNISHSSADDLQVGSGSGSQGITIYSGSSNNGSLYFADGASGNQAYRGFLEYNHTNDHMILGTAGNTRLQVKDDGQVILTGTSTGNHMSTFGSNVGGLTIDDVGNQHTALQVSHGSNNVFLVASSNNSTYYSSYGTGDMIFELTGNGSGSREKLRITSTGQVNIGTSGVLKAEINNSVNGHYFVSQCSDNNDGFEIYQQHGSTASRNTLAVYDNRRGSKIESLLIRGDGVKVTRSRGGNYATTYEFNYNDGAPGGQQTVSLATISNYTGVTSAVAEVSYVGVYATANNYVHSGMWICGVRRANSNSAWAQTANETANGGSSVASLDLYWSNGQLYAQTVGAWMGWTVNVRITILNGDITVNV